MYALSSDPSRALLRAELGGLFTPEDVARFGVEVRAAADAVTCECGGFDMLARVETGVVLGPRIMAPFEALLSYPHLDPRNLAFVAATPQLRTQIDGALHTDNQRVFAHPEDAEAWLVDRSIARITG